MRTEMGLMDVDPHEIAVIPRGIRFQVSPPLLRTADEGLASLCADTGWLWMCAGVADGPVSWLCARGLSGPLPAPTARTHRWAAYMTFM